VCQASRQNDESAPFYGGLFIDGVKEDVSFSPIGLLKLRARGEEQLLGRGSLSRVYGGTEQRCCGLLIGGGLLH
jgi:hypothetical protein